MSDTIADIRHKLFQKQQGSACMLLFNFTASPFYSRKALALTTIGIKKFSDKHRKTGTAG